MNLTIPVYTRGERVKGQAERFTVRPLFFEQPCRWGAKLNRALARLTQDLRRELRNLAQENRHDELARWGFSPPLKEHREALKLELRRRVVNVTVFFVELEALEKRLVFCPELPELWFELERGQALRARASEVLTDYWRDLERSEPPGWLAGLQRLEAKSRGWVLDVEVDVDVSRAKLRADSARRALAALGFEGEVSGYHELHKVGRCLDWLYPDDLDQALLREPEIAELDRMLARSVNRPVLLLGRRQVGKTAIVHSWVHRRVHKRGRAKYGDNVWLLSPQRLISGMSYVGQWEERLLAVLEEARERDHILYFDDLVGLYSAGVSSSSDLSVAHVLKPFVQRQECRIVAEATPEGWRVLQETDRGFADLFHVVRVDEPPPADVLKILIGSVRQLEGQYRCRLEVDALPTVIELQRRYVKDAAFPGKAAAFLRTLAVKFQNRGVSRDSVLETFHEKSGLSVEFLDGRKKLQRGEIQAALERRIIGQSAAIEAMADAVSVAKARLNDPQKPLATLLFLGPTGVGKTECARTLAGYLFGDDDRLLRFDMNELATAYDVSRLIGTFAEPDGLLTGAVRRQPFAVLLFDEIEKGHPDVFDLLLQVLGEGRLTDAVGRTSDFTNTVIILTSNLGVEEAARSLGFTPSERRADSGAEGFVDAARRFFRPEFFNRLDHILPFRHLSRSEVRRIAELLIGDLLRRDGFLHRKCAVQIRSEAMERIVDQGYHPELGARALKRALERQLIQPVAAELASLGATAPILVRAYARRDGIAVHTQELVEANRAVLPADRLDGDQPQAILEGLRATLARLESSLDALQPEGGLTAGDADPLRLAYFTARDQTRYVRSQIEALERRVERPRTTRVPFVARRSRYYKLHDQAAGGLQAIFKAQDIEEYLRELVKAAQPIENTTHRWLQDLVQEVALLDVFVRGLSEPSTSRALLVVYLSNSRGAAIDIARDILPQYSEWFDGYDVDVIDTSRKDLGVLLIEGPSARDLCATDVGTQLLTDDGGVLRLVFVETLPLDLEDDPRAVLDAHFERRQRWLEALESGSASVEDDPWTLRPVVRIGGSRGLVDLRSGVVCQTSDWRIRDSILAHLELPVELEEFTLA